MSPLQSLYGNNNDMQGVEETEYFDGIPIHPLLNNKCTYIKDNNKKCGKSIYGIIFRYGTKDGSYFISENCKQHYEEEIWRLKSESV